MSDQALDLPTAPTRRRGAWIGWLFVLATLVALSGLVLAVVRQEWLGVVQAVAMTVVFALAGARHRYDELPGRVELVGLVAAGAWLALTVAPYL